MSQKLKGAFVVLFIVADVVLVVFLFRQMRSDRYQASDEPVIAQSTRSSPITGGPTGAISLAYSASGTLMRVTRGSCTATGRPFLELSADVGKNFKEIALPLLDQGDNTKFGSRPTTVKTILQVTASSATKFTVIASDEQCVSHRYSTNDAGANWTEQKKFQTWFVNASGDEVVSPGGASQPGCQIVSLSPISDRNAKVACENGSILGTDDHGDTWVTLGNLNNLSAATFDDLRNGYAVAEYTDCKARAYVTNDAGLNWKAAGCVGKNAVQSLVGNAGRLVALVGDRVKISTDGGKTWEVPS